MGIRTDHKLELLKRVPLFAGLSARDIEQVGRLAEEVDLPRDKVLMREGASGDEVERLAVDGPDAVNNVPAHGI